MAGFYWLKPTKALVRCGIVVSLLVTQGLCKTLPLTQVNARYRHTTYQ